MPIERPNRRLTTILAADAAGYSRLVGADEEGTLERLRAIRKDLIDPLIAAHRGRIVKTTGDGLLVEFASVVDAVRSAVEMQRAMADSNACLASDMRIEFRVGINLGDVVVEDDGDLMGDGVNVAARLEGIAEPGGICLSSAAYDQVRGKIDIAAQDRGQQHLKNIAEPVQVYALAPSPAHPARPSRRGYPSSSCPSSTSVATASRTTSSMVSPKASQPTCRAFLAPSSSRATPPSPSRASQWTPA